MLGYGLVQQRALGVARVVELGFCTRLPARMRMHFEVDGLTGEVIENGKWFKERLETVSTREMLFAARAETAGVVVPGGG